MVSPRHVAAEREDSYRLAAGIAGPYPVPATCQSVAPVPSRGESPRTHQAPASEGTAGLPGEREAAGRRDLPKGKLRGSVLPPEEGRRTEKPVSKLQLPTCTIDFWSDVNLESRYYC